MKTFAIIGAMPSELFELRSLLKNAEIKRISGFYFYINNYYGNNIINVCCGITKVNAALCTQVTIDNFHPDFIINTGVAGKINKDVNICDIVISTEVLPHDLDHHFLNDYPPYCAIFKADEKLIGTAKKVCNEFGIKCFCGRIVSGETFISDTTVKAYIQSKFNPYAVDMESAAIGHACYINVTPFVSVRCISDNADNEGKIYFDKFEKIASKYSVKIILHMIEIT